MFVTSILLFYLFITVKCNNISIEPSKNDVELLGDYYENDIAYQNGEDVKLKSVKYGKGMGMDIILKNGFLEVEMDLKNCMGKSIFCYNSTDKMDLLTDMCFSGFCGFKVEGFNGRKDDGTYNENYKRVKTMDNYDYSRRFISINCRSTSIVRMQYWKTIFCGGNYGIMDDYSCAPKTDKNNKIHIYVIEISSQCPVKILSTFLLQIIQTFYF
uniref:Uncharacterized protein n=1 Tax=Panagrolaimus davidi TaxID=227884 RepID=A0A914QBN7_9BILA